MSGLLIVLSGPAGVGKGTIVQGAAARLPQLACSISVTTRPPRPGEVEGRDYFFRTQEQFDRLVAQEAFLEWARYLDFCYGTPRPWVMDQLASGKDVVLEIEVKGGMQVRQRVPGAVLIFVLPPSYQELAERLRGRQTETPEMLERRLQAAREEFVSIGQYDYLIINDKIEQAVDDFCCIVRSEHLRPGRLDLSSLQL